MFKPLIWGKVIKAENSIVLKRLAVQGVGIVFDLPIGFFTEELAAGKLVAQQSETGEELLFIAQLSQQSSSTRTI